MNIFDQPYFLMSIVFIAALLIVEALIYLYESIHHGRRATNRRIRLQAQGHSRDETYQILRPVSPDWVKSLGNATGAYNWMVRMLTESGLPLSVPRLVSLMGILFIVLQIFCLPLVARPIAQSGLGPSAYVITVIATAAIAIAIPIFYVLNRRTSRRNRFAEQFPVALDIMVRALKAGHPIISSIQLVTEEMGDPIGTEFGLMGDEINYGLEFREALDNLVARMDMPDTRYFAVSISIQAQTGGSLSEVLSGLSKVIRERFALSRKVKALSAEARISAVVLTALPFITVSFIMLAQPAFYTRSMGDPLFWPIVGILLVALCCGIALIRKMSVIRV